MAAWILVPLASAVPFMVVLRLDFTGAVFEAVSGWTTTGLSIVDVTSAPKLILLWRSIMQLAGGAGIAILLVATAGGPLGPGLALAEGRPDQLVPHVRRSAALVLTLYSAYTVLGVLSLRAAGMGGFDAVNHAFAAVSTGGFSTRPESIGAWDSAAVELTCMVLMILGNTNFQLVYLLVLGRLRLVARQGEVRFASVLALAAAVALWKLVTVGTHPDAVRAVRVAAFETVTALTTTGFSTTTYGGWPDAGIAVLVLLMVVGGGTGSTAGGIKQRRAWLVLRSIGWHVEGLLAPRNAVIEPRVWSGRGVEFPGPAERLAVALFVAAYVAILGCGSLVLIVHGVAASDAVFEFASALGTVGLSVGVTAAGAPDAVLWTETAGMLLGRLEIFVVLAAAVRVSRDAARLVRG